MRVDLVASIAVRDPHPRPRVGLDQQPHDAGERGDGPLLVGHVGGCAICRSKTQSGGWGWGRGMIGHD